jgi:hypothetical protein
MTTNWTLLNAQAAPFTALATTTDPVSGLVDVTFCGLETQLSAVLQGLPAGGAHSIAIFADTLVVDTASIPATALILVVRNLDVTALNGKPLSVGSSAAASLLAQCLVGGTTGGAFRLCVMGHESASVAPTIGAQTLVAALYQSAAGAPFALIPSGGDASLRDLVSRSWALNSFQAGYTAAAWLMDDGSAPALVTAQAILAWVVACTASLANNLQLPSNYSQLYNQASGLLITLNVAPGATFVPVLSGAFYSQHMSDIITVIRDYESKMDTLDTQGDIAQAIATVSATLQDVASDEITPLRVQLDSISTNAKSLFSDISALRAQFALQTQRAHTAFLVMGDEIALGAIIKQLSAELDLAMSVMSLGFDAVKASEGDAPAMKDAIKDSVEGIKALVDVIEKGKGGDSGDDLADGAADLLTSQMTMMQTVLSGSLLWQQAMEGQSGGVLPSTLSAITLDPTTDWDNYLASAEGKISSIQREVSGTAADAADTYLASLKILTGYGKAIGGKFVAYVAQLVQATIVMAQIKAAQDVEARWKVTQSAADSDVQKLAALKALIQGRMDAIKRSLYLAWTYYAASYFYLNFSAPPHVVHVNMDAADMEAALVGVSDWVARAIGNAPDGQHVQLPSNHAHIELDFTVLPMGGTLQSGDAALLDGSATAGWVLTFTVPIGTEQLDGVLPNNGHCAIWISGAAFFLDGVTPNSKGNVIATIATSGTYQNGVQPATPFTFVTNGLSGNYAYHCPENTVYSAWVIDTQVYMTPTPYTQWTMTLPPNSGDPSTATRLRVQLTIAYAV